MPKRVKCDPQPLLHRKVAILGLRAVGKTSLTNSFVNNTFDDGYDPTIESNLHKVVRFRKVHFATNIIDTAGMDEYSRLSRNASVGVHGYILVFSILSKNSFDRIRQINDVLLNTLGDTLDIPRVLVGSMYDLVESRQVSRQLSLTTVKEAQTLATYLGIPYLEYSSKTGENVPEIFHTLLKEIEKDDSLLNGNEEKGCSII